MNLASCRILRCQRGFALAAAIFVMVVFGALGAYMMGMLGTQLETAPLQLLGARAYQSARAGLEWGVYQALNNPVAACGAAEDSPVATAFSLTEGSLSGFDLRVECSYRRFEEGGECFNVYSLSVQSERGGYGERGYASRTLRGQVGGGAGACP